jgi:ribonuclease E
MTSLQESRTHMVLRSKGLVRNLDSASGLPSLLAAVDALPTIRQSVFDDLDKRTTGLIQLGGDHCQLSPPSVQPVVTLDPEPQSRSGRQRRSVERKRVTRAQSARLSTVTVNTSRATEAPEAPASLPINNDTAPTATHSVVQPKAFGKSSEGKRTRGPGVKHEPAPSRPAPSAATHSVVQPKSSVGKRTRDSGTKTKRAPGASDWTPSVALLPPSPPPTPSVAPTAGGGTTPVAPVADSGSTPPVAPVAGSGSTPVAPVADSGSTPPVAPVAGSGSTPVAPVGPVLGSMSPGAN